MNSGWFFFWKIGKKIQRTRCKKPLYSIHLLLHCASCTFIDCYLIHLYVMMLETKFQIVTKKWISPLFSASSRTRFIFAKWKKFTVWVFLVRRSLCQNQLVDGIRSKALYILSWLEVLFLYHSQKRLGHFNPFSSAFWLTLHLKRIHLCRHVKLWRDGEIVCILQFVFVMDACAWLHKVRPQWIINHLGGPVCNLCLIYFLSGVDGVWLCDQLLQVFLLEWAFNRT